MVKDFRTLVTVIRQKISYLNFITDTDLRLEYEDDEGTFVRLDDTDPDAFFDAQRCAKVVQGTDSRRLKLRVSESSTPQPKMQKLSYSPDAMCTRSISEKNVSLDDATSSNPVPFKLNNKLVVFSPCSKISELRSACDIVINQL